MLGGLAEILVNLSRSDRAKAVGCWFFVAFALFAGSVLVSHIYLVANAVCEGASHCAQFATLEPFPFDPDFRFDIYGVVHFPWTDVAEAILNGLYLSRGWTFGDEAVVNHMPGVYIYLSIFFEAFGLDLAHPSAETTSAAYVIAVFATVMFQIFSAFSAFQLARTPLLTSIVMSILTVTYTGIVFEMALPMSENFIFYLLAPVTVLLYRAATCSDERQRLILVAIAAGPLNLLITLLGLTVFPISVLLAVIFIGVFAAWLSTCLREDKGALYRVRRALAPVALPAGATLVLAIAILPFIDLGGLIFWNFELNAVQTFPPFDIVRIVTRNWRALFDGSLPFGANLFEFLIVLMIFIGMHSGRRDARWPSALLFVFAAACLLAVIAGQWRMSPGSSFIAYKAGAGFGIALGLVAIMVSRLLRDRPTDGLSLAGLVPIIALGLLNAGIFTAATSYSRAPQPRFAGFDDANICRLGETGPDCTCIQLSVFGPQQFLLEDIAACPGRYPSFPSIVARHPVTRARLIADSLDPDISFALYSDAMLTADGFPDEARLNLRENGICHGDENFAICRASREMADE